MLRVNNLVGFGVAVPRPQLTATKTDQNADQSNASSWSDTGMLLGDADPSRIIVISVMSHSVSGSDTHTDVTVGGVSAEKIVESNGGANIASIWWIAVPTGTTANVVVSQSGTGNRAAWQLTRIVSDDGRLPLVRDSDFDGTVVGTPSCSLFIPKNGCGVFALYGSANDSTMTYTAGWTEDTNISFGAENGEAFAGRYASPSVSEQVALDVTDSAHGNHDLAVASFY